MQIWPGLSLPWDVNVGGGGSSKNVYYFLMQVLPGLGLPWDMNVSAGGPCLVQKNQTHLKPKCDLIEEAEDDVAEGADEGAGQHEPPTSQQVNVFTYRGFMKIISSVYLILYMYTICISLCTSSYFFVLSMLSFLCSSPPLQNFS